MDAPRERIRETYEEGVEKARELAESTARGSREALAYTDEWVHTNPWLALSVIAGAGLLVGLLLAQILRER